MSGKKRRLSATEKADKVEMEKAEKAELEKAAEFLEKARKSFECSLCLSLCLPYENPIFLNPCAHIYHAKCIKEVLADAVSAECPQCREWFIADDLKDLKSSNLVFRMLLNLRIDCPLDCKWKGDVADLDSHFDSCEKTQCPFKCVAVVKPPATFEEHNAVCPKFILACTNAGCSIQVPRENLATHLSHCNHAIVECSWAICTYKCKRMESHRHENDMRFHKDRVNQILPPLSEAKQFSISQTVVIELPSTLRMPTAEEQADPTWKLTIPARNFFVGPFKFLIDSRVRNTGILSLGPTLTDERVYSMRLAYSQRLERTDNGSEVYFPINYIELVPTANRFFPDDWPSTIDKWILNNNDSKFVFEENGKKSIRVNIRVYVHDFVLRGQEGENPPTEIRRLGAADGVGVVGVNRKWGKCDF